MYGYVFIMILPVVLAQDMSESGPDKERENCARLAILEERIDELERMTSQVIAFTAYASKTYNYSDKDVVVFDRVITNLGLGYSPSTNRFTCPVHGLYFFSVSIFQAYYMYNPIACTIFLEDIGEIGEVTVKAFGAEGITDSSSTSTVVVCEPGQRVWVEVDDYEGGEVYGGNYEPDTNFMGMFLKVLN